MFQQVLSKGRLPTQVDFDDVHGGGGVLWPAEPLFSRLKDAMADMQLPRLVLRHPEIVSAVLLSLLRLTIEFMEEFRLKNNDKNEEEEIEDDDDEIYFSIYEDFETSRDDDTQSSSELDFNQLSSEKIEQLTTDIASGLIEQWGGVISGVNLSDQLFGRGHGILAVQQEGGGGGAVNGFGLQDGIWKHTAWRLIPELQRQIASMPELRDLMKQLGRHPTADNSDTVHKFAPRKFDAGGGLGAQFDPHMSDSVTGIMLSSSLSEMLSSEAVLLRSFWKK